MLFRYLYFQNLIWYITIASEQEGPWVKTISWGFTEVDLHVFNFLVDILASSHTSNVWELTGVNSCLSLLALTGSAPLQPWIKLDGCFSELGDQSWYNIWLCMRTHTHTHLCSILENEGFSIWEASLSFGLHCNSLYCLLLVQLFLGSSQPPVLASLWDSELISKSSCLFSHSWFNSFLHLWPLRALWCSRSLQSDRQMFQTVPQSRVKLRHFLPPNCGTAFQH